MSPPPASVQVARAFDSVSISTHRSGLARLGLYLGRSLVPVLALGVIAGTAVWGPWVSLVLAYGAWRAAGRFA